MKFGQKLLQSRYEPWSDYYLDYQQLKTLLKEQNTESATAQHADNNGMSAMTSHASLAALSTHFTSNRNSYSYGSLNALQQQQHLRSISLSNLTALPVANDDSSDNNNAINTAAPPGLSKFVQCLNIQVERMLLFFLQEQAKIAAQLQTCRQDLIMLQQLLQEQQQRQRQRQQSVLPPDSFFYDDNYNASNATMTIPNDEDDDQDLQALQDPNQENQQSVLLSSSLSASLCQKYWQVAMHLLRLFQFVDCNMTGLRKILKKHDKHSAAVPGKQKLTQIYLGKRAVVLHPMASGESLDALTKLLESSLREWTMTTTTLLFLLVQQEQQVHHDSNSALHSRSYHQHQHQLLLGLSSLSSPSWTPTPTSIAERKQYKHNEQWVPNVQQQQSSPGGGRGMTKTWSFVVAAEAAATATNNNNRMPPDWVAAAAANPGDAARFSKAILSHIKTARSRLQETSEFVKMLAAPVVVLNNIQDRDHSSSCQDGSQTENDDDEEEEEEFDDDDDVGNVAAQRQRQRVAISNFLNYTSTFLYMANYYIVAPASNTYAEKLGGNASQAGIIIGMTPVAALISTLLYSWWTSYSYKSALIFASLCSCIGNLCYGLGLPFHSLELVLIGRLWNGFGSARSINRRYIADSYSRRQRTAASATFVTAGALGCSIGPAIAALLEVAIPHNSNNMDDNTRSANDSVAYNPYWQVENAPGWIMFVLWCVYLVCLIAFFQDPPRPALSSSLLLLQGKVRQGLEKDTTKKTSAMLASDEKEPLLFASNDAAAAAAHDAAANVLPFSVPTMMAPIALNGKRNYKPRALASCSQRYIPVIVPFAIYFILKLILETTLSSIPMITTHYFRWTGKLSGTYLAILGLFLLPANALVGYISSSYEDRDLVVGIQFVQTLGCLAMLNYHGSKNSQEYSLTQYLMASMLCYVSASALEGPNMSLLSKTIPKSWSKGFFNVGLLATEAGTLGRAVADVLLTACGANDMDYLLNRVFGICAGVSFVMLLLSMQFYAFLVVPSDDDDW